MASFWVEVQFNIAEKQTSRNVVLLWPMGISGQKQSLEGTYCFEKRGSEPVVVSITLSLDILSTRKLCHKTEKISFFECIAKKNIPLNVPDLGVVCAKSTFTRYQDIGY